MTYGNKLHLKFDASGYVIDGVFYQPGSYTIFEGEEIPEDFLNSCYQLIDGEFVLDQEKYDLLYPEEEDPGIPPIF